ncbi:ComEA family DNA-binding protein [Marinibactrum halimedae]|uniref:Helix-hairpin-helix DNA-binding motif class 1 domain-containing protein n=1 Tax=Marinibactrum halimedae TaxID=1444977 RepID=A0AA37TD08_9GAMM|nr:helix-hairpin-helix domain-containing protein [Marinibactrum halimedae]MCD9459825.1 helix-hairpin-helix domain-containing protein [Marinibactrum halimedae]GLS26982.1 hypothetical protein GCM10007877_27010 [Marinibactrum halimedae]
MASFQHLKSTLTTAFFVLLMFASGTVLAQAETSQSAASVISESVSDIVNINTAPAERLAKVLHGVGPKKAEAIVVWREENGGFQHVEELMEVKGIGEKLMDKNRDRIVIQ